MDLPCVPWQEHVARKWAGLEPELRERFKSMLEIKDVIESALSLTTQDDVKCLHSISAGRPHHHTRKDAESAAACRERGNASFKGRRYTEAALHYSQGVCLAPQGSEQLPLCYANRSAALFHLQRYQEALDDAAEAERTNYPSGLSHKLEKRRAQCLARLSSSELRADQEEGVRSGVSPKGVQSGVSPKVTVRVSLEKGRHVVASETIEAGEVILSERPYSFVLVPSSGGAFGSEHRRCHACLNPTWRPVPCGGCSYARYCAASCRDRAWEEYHCQECPLGAHVTALGILSQLALRVALKAGLKNIRQASGAAAEPPADPSGAAYEGVSCLLHHLDRQSASMRFLCAVTMATLCLELSGTGPPPAGRQVAFVRDPVAEDQGWRLLAGAALRHLLQLRCNAQAVVMLEDQGLSDALVLSSQERRVATAIFPTLSLFNHSCRPNTSLMFGGGGIVTVRASRSVNAGREVLHCYGPHNSSMAAAERRHLLQEQYFFLCQCEACEEERAPGSSRDGASGLLCAECDTSLASSGGGDLECRSCGFALSCGDLTERLQDVRRDLDEAVDLLEKGEPGETLALLERSGCLAGVTLPHTHQLQGRMDDTLARAHATNGNWSRAALHLERSSAAVAARFGADSVEMARQLAKLAQLHFNAGSRASALSVIPEARRLLSLHCGALCPEVQELQAMEDCLHNS
ncbi:SET and MYND domain-containing protein 4 [Phyllopteryx taeniolatus]|uniref:SET and MYND domain-containing protein 4 n=1 Tax=Phyllopteryx taeniolatus TaxID=161469 RepID=UPI002AD4336B|nr:SET and MYND domain-containing protein 4 [Phyllopteryx taeniolatus]